MKNVNVLLAVVLCAGLCVLFGLFNRSADESLGWSPNDMYMQSISSGEGASFTSANLSGGNVSNDGVAVSMRNGSFSLRTRARHTSSPNSLIANGVPEKSADFLGALSPNSPIASSPNSLIGHMTSSAEFHSFGGGSNMAMGSYTSSSNSLLASSPAIGSYSQSPSSPIALSPNASGVGFNNLPSLQGGAGGRPVISAEQALMSASSSASSLFGGMMTSYGTASYDQTIYGSYGSTPSGVRGRQNVGSGSSNNPNGWLAWLADYARGLYGYEPGGTNSYGFDYYQLQDAYEAWLAEWMSDTGLTKDMAPSFDDFLNWFYENEFTYNWTDGTGYSATLRWVPVGNMLPLLILALMYVVYMVIHRRKYLSE